MSGVHSLGLKRLRLEFLERREMMSGGSVASVLGAVAFGPAFSSSVGASGGTQLPLSFPQIQQSELALIVLSDRYEPDNTAAQATKISTTGNAQLHSLNKSTDVDWVKFTLTERSSVVIQTKGLRGNTDMSLFGPGGDSNLIAYDNGGGGFAKIQRRDADALDAGTYYVEVGEYGRDATIGAYKISVKSTPAPLADALENDDTRDKAQPIGVNVGPQTHSIHVASDVDWATFTLDATADVVIETRGASGDTRLWLYGSDPRMGPVDVPIEFDNNDGVDKFSVIVRAGDDALAAGTYYVKVDESGNNAVISSYTLSVTALQKGDVLVTQGKGLVSTAIRVGEARELDVAFADTFSHSAIYIGDGSVAEMLASGFTITSLEKRYAESQRVDILRDRDIGDQGAAVVDAALEYAGTPYAFSQIAVFARATLFSGKPEKVVNSTAYKTYEKRDSGSQSMICSELVARAFADASLPLDVKLWPTLSLIEDPTDGFSMDFTSPTMLALSPDLIRLNA